jgi:hypothetical protein
MLRGRKTNTETATMGSLLREFWLFLMEEKKWWLVPLLLVMGVIGVLVILGQMYPALAPFVYPFI